MQLLWQWSCDLTAGRNVSCMAWNHERHDLLAVGYGSFEFERQQGGLVCLWSMRNPSYPLWWFELESGVTALDFSKATGACLMRRTNRRCTCDCLRSCAEISERMWPERKP